MEISPGIASEPGILSGKPVLRGRRIPVVRLMEQLAGGMTLREIQEDYRLSDEEIGALLTYIESL